MKILFIGKQGHEYANIAAEYVKSVFHDTTIVFGTRKDSFPAEIKSWEGDYIFSYLSQWIIPKEVLERARLGGINWHPGPPEYPGIGCTNFAIYNREEEFGITCHFMNPKVDTGEIIEVKRFEVLEEDTVFSLTQKCYDHIHSSFIGIVDLLASGIQLPNSDETWQRKPYTRRELDELCRIEHTMSKDEINQRIKATKFDKHWAYTEIKGFRFMYTES